MKSWIVSLLAGLAFAGLMVPASAANAANGDPERVAAAKELLSSMGGARQVLASVAQLRDALSKDMGEREPTKAKEFASFLEKETNADSERVKALIAGIDEAATAFYAERFTADEMKAIAAFQKSEAGRKFQELTPQLAAVVGPRLMEFQKQLIGDLQVATGQPSWPAPKSSDAKK